MNTKSVNSNSTCSIGTHTYDMELISAVGCQVNKYVKNP